MSEQVKVDAIVVGGGPAGLCAALELARQDLEVILVERGEYAGSKNMGGLLYTTVLSEMLPDFADSAPLERPVTHRRFVFLTSEGHMGVDFSGRRWQQPPHNHAWTVHRAQFDRWMASQIEEAGVSLLEGMVVDELIYEGEGKSRKAAGVRIRGAEEEFLADVVLLCDGANNLVSRQAMQELKMSTGRHPQEYAVGVKQTIKLSKGAVEDRFGLEDGQGAAIDFFGTPFGAAIGGGFIYTQKETVSIGFAARIASLKQHKLSTAEMMDGFLNHETVRPLLRGGELQEYSAHMIPEGGWHAMPQLSANGLLIAGDAAGLVNFSVYKEGTNLAMESGRLAAQAVLSARAAGDFSRAGLQSYESRLHESTTAHDLRKYADMGKLLEELPEITDKWPALANRLMVDYFSMTGEPKSVLQKRARQRALAELPKFTTLRKLFKARKLI